MHEIICRVSTTGALPQSSSPDKCGLINTAPDFPCLEIFKDAIAFPIAGDALGRAGHNERGCCNGCKLLEKHLGYGQLQTTCNVLNVGSAPVFDFKLEVKLNGGSWSEKYACAYKTWYYTDVAVLSEAVLWWFGCRLALRRKIGNQQTQ